MITIKYAFINEETDVQLFREFTTTKKSYITSSNSTIVINNNEFIQQFPQVKIIFSASATNPTLYFSNNSTQNSCQINASFVKNDFVVLDSRTKTAKKNGTINLNISPTLFPVINQMQYFKCWISSSIATLELTYTDVEDSPIYTRSRNGFNINFTNKQVDLGKQFYNSDNKQNINLSTNIGNFDFSLPLITEDFLDMINSNDTFKLVWIADNTDEFSIITRVLCNCSLNISMDSQENALVSQKVQGSGVILGEMPSLHDLFYYSDSVQLTITNSTKNLICEIPYAEISSCKLSPKYREKKIFRQKPKKILEELSISIDLSSPLVGTRIKEWIGDNLTASINYINATTTIPISMTNVTIENLTYNSEKDGIVKENYTLNGYL